MLIWLSGYLLYNICMIVQCIWKEESSSKKRACCPYILTFSIVTWELLLYKELHFVINPSHIYIFCHFILDYTCQRMLSLLLILLLSQSQLTGQWNEWFDYRIFSSGWIIWSLKEFYLFNIQEVLEFVYKFDFTELRRNLTFLFDIKMKLIT